jgi:drug/metabolite transporter (DMT)-like permease
MVMIAISGFSIALLASALYAATNKLDEGLLRFLGREDEKSPVPAMVIFSSLSSCVIISILGLIAGSKVLIEVGQVVGLLTAGALTMGAIILYLYAMEKDGASVVVPIYQTIPVFAYGLGWLFLGETLSKGQLVAGGIMVLAAMFISVELGERTHLRAKTLVSMLGSSALYAMADVLYKGLALENIGFVTGSFWRFGGYFLVGLIFYLVPRYRHEFNAIVKEKGRVLFFNLGGEGVYQVSDVAVNAALLLAPVTIVLLGLSFQPVFVLLFGVILAKMWPSLFEEDLSSSTLIQKVVAVAIMITASLWLE